jgi:divalent metal cation (Fe/Co/Zn/Cd) transporter
MIRTLCNNIYLRLILLYPFTLFSQAWWVDPLGAILISLVIIYRWGNIMSEQVKKIVGHTAPPDFIIKVRCYVLNEKRRDNCISPHFLLCRVFRSTVFVF